MTDINLETKFQNFMDCFEGSINLDNGHFFTGEKADYLLLNGSVIVEIKTLTKDREEEVVSWMQKKLRDSDELRKGMPLLFGKMPAHKVLEKHKNPGYILPRYRDVCARTIKALVRKATDQIENTKQQMKLAGSFGILVILNPDLAFYSDEFVAGILYEKFTSKRTGQAITAVIFIMDGYSVGYVITDISRELEVKNFLDEFISSWIRFDSN